MPQPFNNAVMTNAGATLLTRAQAGEISIEFTRLATGNGEYTAEEKTLASLQERSALKTLKNSYSLSSVSVFSEHSVKVTALITNYDSVGEKTIVTEGYYINEIGLFAKPKGEGDDAEVLYSVAVTSGDKGDFMPPYNGYNPAQITQDYYATVSNSAEVTINNAGAVALASDMGNVSELETEKKNVVGAINELNESMIKNDDYASEKKAGLVKPDGEFLIAEADGTLKVLASAIDVGLRNGIFRGKNLGSEFTAEQKAVIAAGTFDNMFIGDYWEIDGIKYRIAAFDYWLHCGDTECTAHHVVLVPDTNLYTAQMNSSNITTGGYTGSEMYTKHLAEAKTKIKAAFGEGNILSHREYLTNAVTNGKPSAGAWFDSDVELMNEPMVYGSYIFTPTSDGTTISNIHTIGKSQLPLFALRPDLITNRAGWWLRDVVSGAAFALVSGSGHAGYNHASNTDGVRPAFAIC